MPSPPCRLCQRCGHATVHEARPCNASVGRGPFKHARTGRRNTTPHRFLKAPRPRHGPRTQKTCMSNACTWQHGRPGAPPTNHANCSTASSRGPRLIAPAPTTRRAATKRGSRELNSPDRPARGQGLPTCGAVRQTQQPGLPCRPTGTSPRTPRPRRSGHLTPTQPSVPNALYRGRAGAATR